MTEKEWLFYLMHVFGIGAVTIGKLREYFCSFGEIWTADEAALIQSKCLTAKQLEALTQTRRQEEVLHRKYEKMMRDGIQFVTRFEETYPKRLLPYRDSPAGLFVRGKMPEDEVPTVAIVGARNCTEYGRNMAASMAETLAASGVQVISGLAMGVDGAAHRGSLKAGGSTFAVLGCGIDICYPREHIQLFGNMQERGGILTEFVPGTGPAPGNFPMRNRIISGLSDAVVLIEARKKSGSLITADLALEQGKEVFALPGRPCDPLSEGCNRLLQMGAAVCLGAEDVLEFLGLKYEKKLTVHENSEKILAKTENMVYSFLDSRPKHLEEIVKNCQISVPEAMECLTALELTGAVISAGNQYYCRKM